MTLSFLPCVSNIETGTTGVQILLAKPFGNIVPATGANALNTFGPSQANKYDNSPPFDIPVKKVFIAFN